MSAEAGVEDDDAWLYGDNSAEDQRKEEINAIFDRATEELTVPGEESTVTTNGEVVEPAEHQENGESIDEIESAEPKLPENEEKESDEDEDSDDDDDDVQVTIGDIKPASTTYPYGGAPVNLNIKRGSAFTSGPGAGSISKSKGLDLETVGIINGVSIYEFNLDSIEDKPWRKPGADITDYFNYGFSEDSWKAYCEKQRKLRIDNHQILPNSKTPLVALGKDQQIPIATVNENSKYSGMGMVAKKAGPPPGRRMSGSIDVICGTNTAAGRRAANSKENVIQVIGQGDVYNGSLPPGMPPTHIPPPFIPPNLSVPPPGLPPGLAPPNIPPPPGTIPGHVPFPDLYGNPIFTQPPPPVPGVSVDAAPQYDEQFFTGSQSSRQFDGNSESQHSWNNNSPRDRDRDRDRLRDRDRIRDRSRDKTRDPDYWDRDTSRDRSLRMGLGEEDYKRRDRDEYDHRRYREYRDRREKDRYERDYERVPYERDREKEGREHYERDREKDSREQERERRHRDHKEREERGERHKERSSRRRHHHEDDEEYHSSRHKHKKSKREKEDSSTPVVEASEDAAQAENEGEEK